MDVKKIQEELEKLGIHTTQELIEKACEETMDIGLFIERSYK